MVSMITHAQTQWGLMFNMATINFRAWPQFEDFMELVNAAWIWIKYMFTYKVCLSLLIYEMVYFWYLFIC